MSREEQVQPSPERAAARGLISSLARAPIAGLGQRLPFACRWTVRVFVLFAFLTALLIPTGDRFILTRTEEAAQAHLFSIVDWEIGNFLDKWAHQTLAFLTGGTSEKSARASLDRYLTLTEKMERLRTERAPAVADPDAMEDRARGIDEEIASLEAERSLLRNEVEAYLEGAVSSALREEGLGLFGELVWPPVDIRLDSPPRVLVTSPRDEILRLESVLLRPNMSPIEADTVEEQIRQQQNLSALVVALGGLATYPNFVRDDRSLFDILEKTAHEWLHAYLFFHPLGFKYDANDQMQTLNETVANVAGGELGKLAYTRLTGQRPPGEPADEPRPPDEAEGDTQEFSFNDFMHQTRVKAGELLSGGKIEAAEAYMESRRRELISHGFFVRKLNQAWFAFHGTYADTGASISPIGPEVTELRALSADVGEFVRLVRGAGSYGEFKKLLARRQAETGAASVEES